MEVFWEWTLGELKTSVIKGSFLSLSLLLYQTLEIFLIWFFIALKYPIFLEIGSSPDACSEYYAGPKAFSEKETLALSEFLKTLNIKLYIDFHSYGQLLMFPVVSIATFSFRFRISRFLLFVNF